MDEVVGVVGCSGGIGASSFAAGLARAAPDALLIDLDAGGGGIDVLLGIDDRPGVRWSGIDIGIGIGGVAVGAERFAGDALRRGLPTWDGCAVLAADGVDPEASTVRAVLAGGGRGGPVVVDLPRARGRTRSAGLAACRLVVLLVRGDTGGVAAAHAVVGGLDGAPAAVVVRRGPLAPPEVADAVGLPLLGALPREMPPFRPGVVPRADAGLTAGIWAGLRGTDGSTGWAA